MESERSEKWNKKRKRKESLEKRGKDLITMIEGNNELISKYGEENSESETYIRNNKINEDLISQIKEEIKEIEEELLKATILMLN